MRSEKERWAGNENGIKKTLQKKTQNGEFRRRMEERKETEGEEEEEDKQKRGWKESDEEKGKGGRLEKMEKEEGKNEVKGGGEMEQMVVI